MKKEISSEQAIAALRVIDFDELNIEIIEVKVRYYKEELLFDDDGEPLQDRDGNQLKGRKPAIRTAHIQNMVSVDVYHEAMAFMSQSLSEAEQIDLMRNLVLRIWQISEPFMSKEMLAEGIDFETTAAIFARFFNNENRLLSSKA